MRKTNPIRACGSGRKEVGRGPNAQNKPNFSCRASRAAAGVNLAKQTQFATQRTGTGRRDRAKRSQLALGRCQARTPNPRRAEGRSCETKPIWPRRTGIPRLRGGGLCPWIRIMGGTPMPLFRWTGYPTIPVSYHSTIPARGRWCKTKPISPVGQGRRGRDVQNEPLSSPAEMSGGDAQPVRLSLRAGSTESRRQD
jgi:hypothetical protein